MKGEGTEQGEKEGMSGEGVKKRIQRKWLDQDGMQTINVERMQGKGPWVAQSVEHLTLAQVMILWLMSSSPTLGSVLTAQSLEPASDSVSPSLSAPPLPVLCLSLSQKINIKGRLGGAVG